MTAPATTCSPGEFRAALTIDDNGKRRKLGESLDPWQRADFEALDPAWLQMVRSEDDVDESIVRRAYLERPRGHSKSTDIAAMVTWALYACDRKLEGIAGAADKDQAGLLLEKIDIIVRLNPWLAAKIEVQSDRVVNKSTGSYMEILAADAASSFGYTPDFVICDELTHWPKKGVELWGSMSSSAAKRAKAVTIIITNAGNGKGRSWQWKLRESCRTSARWYFSRREGPEASWITAANLDAERENLPPTLFNRVWLNIWQTGDGDALDPADIAACVTLTGPMPAYVPEFEFVAGLDLGISHDHAALVILAVSPATLRVRLAWCQSWKPGGPDGKIHLPAVEAALEDARVRYKLAGCYYDPHQAELMAQNMRGRGLWMAPVTFQGKSADNMAQALVAAFRGRLIDLYPEPELMADLPRLSIVANNNGTLKLTATRDEDGHADRAIALSIVLPGAMQYARELAAATAAQQEQQQGGGYVVP